MQIPKNLEMDGLYHQYCLNCFKEQVKRVYDKQGLTKYSCLNCKSVLDRSLVFDPAIVSWIDNERAYWHKSVGVLVYNPQGKILFFKRNIFPFVLTIPAGHVDTGEQSLSAGQRELKEESGIETESLSLVFEGPIVGDSCRRGSDHHYWNLYSVKVDNNNVKKNNEEGGEFVWLAKHEIQLKEVTPPVRFFINSGFF